MMNPTLFRPSDGRKDYSLIPDYYDQGQKKVRGNRRTVDVAQYNEISTNYSPQYTRDFASNLMQSDNFNEVRDWRDFDGRGQVTGSTMGMSGSGALREYGSKMNNDKFFFRKFSERFMNYRKDHTMVEPFSTDETGLTMDVDIDHSNSHDARVYQFQQQSNKSQFFMQHQRQAPGETPVDVDTNRNPWISRGYSGLGSSEGHNSSVGDKPITKYEEIQQRQRAAYSTLRVVDGDIPESHQGWSPAVIYQYPYVLPRADADNGESNPDKHDPHLGQMSHFRPDTGLPDKHQQMIDSYAIATPMIGGYFPRNPQSAKEYLEKYNNVNSDIIGQEVRAVAPQFMRDLISKIDPAGMVSDTYFIEETMSKYPSLQDIQVQQRNKDDVRIDGFKADSVILNHSYDMTLEDFSRREANRTMFATDETQVQKTGKDLKDFQALGRDFINSISKSSEMHSRTPKGVDLPNGLPKIDTQSTIFALDSRQVANLGSRVLADAGSGITMEQFATDINPLEARQMDNSMDRSFDEYLVRAHADEKPNRQNKETMYRGAAFAGASGLMTKTGLMNDY